MVGLAGAWEGVSGPYGVNLMKWGEELKQMCSVAALYGHQLTGLVWTMGYSDGIKIKIE